MCASPLPLSDTMQSQLMTLHVMSQLMFEIHRYSILMAFSKPQTQKMAFTGPPDKNGILETPKLQQNGIFQTPTFIIKMTFSRPRYTTFSVLTHSYKKGQDMSPPLNKKWLNFLPPPLIQKWLKFTQQLSKILTPCIQKLPKFDTHTKKNQNLTHTHTHT